MCHETQRPSALFGLPFAQLHGLPSDTDSDYDEDPAYPLGHDGTIYGNDPAVVQADRMC